MFAIICLSLSVILLAMTADRDRRRQQRDLQSKIRSELDD